MNRRTRLTQIGKAIDAIEELGPDVAWSLGTVTNDYGLGGRGVAVLIKGPDAVVVQEQGRSFAIATERAIGRFKRRLAGETWA